MDNPRVLVIIPAYNEEKNIHSVIQKLKYCYSADILVVDDGSKDITAEKAAEEDVTVVKLPFNLGIGGAMQTGYIYARDNGYDIAIQLDADGQHDPEYIERLVIPVINKKCDMSIGSRYLEQTAYKSTASRRAGMLFFSWLVRVLTGNSIKDTTSGFRAVNKDILEYFASNYPTDYPEVDVLVRLHKKGFRMLEVPVEMKERQGGKSSITPIKSFYYMIKVSLALIINSMRTGEMI